MKHFRALLPLLLAALLLSGCIPEITYSTTPAETTPAETTPASETTALPDTTAPEEETTSVPPETTAPEQTEEILTAPAETTAEPAPETAVPPVTAPPTVKTTAAAPTTTTAGTTPAMETKVKTETTTTTPAKTTPAKTEPVTAAPTETETEPEIRTVDTCLMYVTGSRVNLRKTPSLEGTVLKQLDKGKQVTKHGESGDWAYVEADEVKGFIRGDYLSKEKPAEPAPKAETQTADRADRIVVYKGSRTLELWQGETLLFSCSVGLGWTPEGHKQVEGDGKTPEGRYYVCRRRENGSFYKSLGVSYPNKEDAKAGLEDGRIDQATYDRIAKAIDAGESPSWTTPLGGAILIHGCGGQTDWTAGCVGLDNEDMDVVYDACPMGTPILIYP